MGACRRVSACVFMCESLSVCLEEGGQCVWGVRGGGSVCLGREGRRSLCVRVRRGG